MPTHLETGGLKLQELVYLVVRGDAILWVRGSRLAAIQPAALATHLERDTHLVEDLYATHHSAQRMAGIVHARAHP
jgi:hypothetical protein